MANINAIRAAVDRFKDNYIYRQGENLKQEYQTLMQGIKQEVDKESIAFITDRNRIRHDGELTLLQSWAVQSHAQTQATENLLQIKQIWQDVSNFRPPECEWCDAYSEDTRVHIDKAVVRMFNQLAQEVQQGAEQRYISNFVESMRQGIMVVDAHERAIYDSARAAMNDLPEGVDPDDIDPEFGPHEALERQRQANNLTPETMTILEENVVDNMKAVLSPTETMRNIMQAVGVYQDYRNRLQHDAVYFYRCLAQGTRPDEQQIKADIYQHVTALLVQTAAQPHGLPNNDVAVIIRAPNNWSAPLRALLQRTIEHDMRQILAMQRPVTPERIEN